MRDTAPAPVPPDQAIVSESETPVSLPLPPAPNQRLGGMTRIVRGLVAVPLAVLRHPLRSLAIAALLLLIGWGAYIATVWLWASHHLRLGRELMERYHTTEAVPHLQDALSVWPRDPETLLLVARAARRAGVLEQAEHFLDLYEELRKEDDALTLERVCLRAERGDPESVSAFCGARIEANDPSASLLLEAMAKGYIQAYQPYQALAVTRRWLELEPDNAQVLLIQGRALDLGARKAEAIRSFRGALELDPTLEEARERLCDVLMEQGSTEEASPQLDYLNARFPNDPKVQVYLARVQNVRGHPEEAEQMIDAVLARRPHFGMALLDRGLMALRAGRPVEAERWLREAVKYDPSNVQAHHQLALALEQNSKFAEADKIGEKIKRMELDTKDILDIVGGGMERAPRDPDMHYRLGMISMRAGNTREALRWLNSALKEDPHHQDAHKALMEHYQRIGDYGRAREHRQQLKDDKPDAQKKSEPRP